MRCTNMATEYDIYALAVSKQQSTLPVCHYCDEPIDDDKLFDINGRLYHAECAACEYERDTEDYIRGWWE